MADATTGAPQVGPPGVLGASYDPEADALYVRFRVEPRVGPSIEVDDSTVVDVGADGEPVGIEVLGLRALAERAARDRPGYGNAPR